MIREATRKWQKKVKTLEESVDYEKRLKNGFREELTAVKAKLERYEEQEQKRNRDQMVNEREMESQVIWLRNLVEQLVISPNTIKATTNKEIRFQEMENRRAKQRHKEEMRYMAMQNKPDGVRLAMPKEEIRKFR